MTTEHMINRMIPAWAYQTSWAEHRAKMAREAGASGAVKCNGCGRTKVTLLKREGRYICKDCWNTLQRIRAKSVGK